MEKQETPRQKKISIALQKEIAYLLQESIRKGNVSNLITSVTKVRVSPDLSNAKVYLSLFPNKNSDYFKNLKETRDQLRHDLSQRMRSQIRKVPNLDFYIDNSLDYIEAIEQDLLKGENPFDKK